MKKSYSFFLLPIGISMMLVSCTLFFYNVYAALAGIILTLVCVFASLGVIRKKENEERVYADAIFHANEAAAGKLINAVQIPCMLLGTNGRIVWRNSAMQTLFDGADAKRLPDACMKTSATSLMEFAGGQYQIRNMPVERSEGSRELIFQYWTDRTETEHYKRLYEEQMPQVAFLFVDNYEELAADIQFHRSSVLTEVERLVSELVAKIDGIYRRYESGRFLLVFEAKHLETLEKERFAILEEAHRLITGTDQHVTLSIAVGAANRLRMSDADARQAMELALGRGGDQAVVKRGINYKFYGGRRQVEARQSRVKARLFAKALRQLMENSTDVFVMGHKIPDMDCLGAAVGIVCLARRMGIPAHIVLEGENPSIEQALSEMKKNKIFDGVFISPEVAKSQFRMTSVLVIVDTQRPNTTISPDLLSKATKLVLIDHHRRSPDYIDNATLNYLESRASSTCEMVTETIQYFDENIKPTAFECSVLLAGITVDTKHFAFNVGARTFEAAGYLRKNGADIGMVKMMFRDDLETYAARVDVVRKAILLENGVAIATHESEKGNVNLICAQAADELIGIRGIEAAFVLGQVSDYISVSGRSLGQINVQVILEKIGGGGHLTMAGAQLYGLNMPDAIISVKEAIRKYFEENEGNQ